MTAPQLRLTYFHYAGRAELLRLLFTYGGVAFEYSCVSKSEFDAMKASLPLGQLPILEVDGIVFSQSMAIARYAAKASGLYPHDPVQALRVDMISETLADLGTRSHAVICTPDAELQAERTAIFLNETAPRVLTALEMMVQGEFFLGDDSASMADVQLLDVTSTLLASYADFSLAAHPKLHAIVERVKANAHIAAFLSQ